MSKSAIPGAKRGDIFWVEPEDVTIIGLDTLHKAGEHPLWDKRIFDPVPEAKVNNIRTYGVREAVKVRKTGMQDGKAVLEVIDGRGRTRAARLAKERAEAAGEVAPALPVMLVRESEERQIGIMVSCNEHRKDDDVLNKARKAAHIASMGRHSRGELANMFGVDNQTILLWENILALAPKVLEAIEQGKLSAYACRPLFKLPHDEQVEKLQELLETGIKPSEKNMRCVAAGNKPARRGALLPKPKIRKLISDEQFYGSLSPDAQALLRVILGEEDAIQDVTGLAERLKAQEHVINAD
jgi:ParB family chromosome partitioning protein